MIAVVNRQRFFQVWLLPDHLNDVVVLSVKQQWFVFVQKLAHLLRGLIVIFLHSINSCEDMKGT